MFSVSFYSEKCDAKIIDVCVLSIGLDEETQAQDIVRVLAKAWQEDCKCVGMGAFYSP